MNARTALVVGASRGIGLGFADQLAAAGWQVIATRRTGSDRTKLDAVRAAHASVEIAVLDLEDRAGIDALGRSLPVPRLDLLIINAGIGGGQSDPVRPLTEASETHFARLMRVNAAGPLLVIEAFERRVAPDGRIGILSSSLGSIAENRAGGFEAYRASKAALNTLVQSHAARRGQPGPALVLLDPGWVRTDLGGAAAPLGVEESVAGMLAVLAAAPSPTCEVLYVAHDGRPIPW